MMSRNDDGAAHAEDDLPLAKRVHAYAHAHAHAHAQDTSGAGGAAASPPAHSPQSPASPASPGVFGGGVSPSPSPSTSASASADARGKRSMTQAERDKFLAEALAPLTQYTAINHVIRDAHLGARQRAEHNASLADVERARLSTEPYPQQDAALGGFAAVSPSSASSGAASTRKRGADGPPT
jgi:hypothetical protein